MKTDEVTFFRLKPPKNPPTKLFYFHIRLAFRSGVFSTFTFYLFRKTRLPRHIGRIRANSEQIRRLPGTASAGTTPVCEAGMAVCR